MLLPMEHNHYRTDSLRERARRKAEWENRQRQARTEREPGRYFRSWTDAITRGYVWEPPTGAYECPKCPGPLRREYGTYSCHGRHVRVEPADVGEAQETGRAL